jgi:Concanavalin A-like lectin/glucanases superfamily/Pectinesterase
MINYTEKGYGMHQAVEAAGYILYQLDGVWYSDDDVAVQAIIDAYVENPAIEEEIATEGSAVLSPVLSAQLSQHPARLLEVDCSRIDDYEANGSNAKPFKTIQAAIDAVPSGTSQNSRWGIHICAGVYIENVILNKPYVSLIGDDWVTTCIKGDFTINANGTTEWRNSIVSMKLCGSAIAGTNHVSVNVAGTPTAKTTVNFKNCYIRDWDYIDLAFSATVAGTYQADYLCVNFFETYFGDSHVTLTRCDSFNINSSWGAATTTYDHASVWQVGGWQLGTFTLVNGASVVSQTCPQLDPSWCYLAFVVGAGCSLAIDDAVATTTYSITGAGTTTYLGLQAAGTSVARGIITNSAQTIAGAKTFTSEVVMPDVKLTPGSAPTPAEGQVYYDSTSKVLKFWNGTEWRTCSNVSGLIEGLTYYWKMNDAIDTITGTVGTITGTMTFGPTYGKIGNGCLGGADGSFGAKINTGVLGFSNNSSRTISSWFYVTPNCNSSGECMILGGVTPGMIICAQATKDGFPPVPPYTRAYCYMQVHSPTQQLGSDAAPFRVTLDAWHHLVGTYDGAAQRMYIDGSLVATGTLTSLTNTPSNLIIGNFIGPQQGFIGNYVDEIGVWSRALSANDVTVLYNAGAGKQHPF